MSTANTEVVSAAPTPPVPTVASQPERNGFDGDRGGDETNGTNVAKRGAIDDRDTQSSGGQAIGFHDLRVKPEFVLEARAECLGPIRIVADGAPENLADDRDGRNDRDRKKKRNKKRRGLNKKRPRDVREEASEKVCMAVLRGADCPFGESCRFSHDLKGYMATRPSDITELVEAMGGTCPTFKNSGYCFYGAMCRLGSCHITKTGENVRNEEVSAERRKENGGDVDGKGLEGLHGGTLLPRDVVTQLRKKTYPFQCKRYCEKEEKKKPKEEPEDNGGKLEQNTVETGTAIDPLNAMNSNDAKDLNSPTFHKAETTSNASSNASSSTPLDKPKTKKIVDFSNKIYVAPLTTVGNLPFRRIMKQFGADITCGEMAVVTNLLEGKPSEWALLKRHPSEDVFGIQLAAAHIDQFTRVSELVEKFTDVDFVDMNLGCPLDLLCQKGAGAALMMREKKLKGALEGMSKHLSCSITVKMRTGWNIHRPFAHELVPKIQSWNTSGLAAIMVHGRSRLQRYKLDANWDYISQVATSQSKESPPIPIIGNGDIFSYSEYKEKVLADENLTTTAMLGRGALIKPWLPTEIKEKRDWDISATERLDILKDFVKHGLEHWGSDQQGINNTRRFLLEWLSFLYRYVPVGLLEVLPQKMNQRPPLYMQGRSDLETLFLSPHSSDWVKISEMLLGPVPDGFAFQPKHKSAAYESNG
mmetsp:Transcript_21392/g.50927  ORF Transcript_21392/g.50927 Transcript_21392/m.50927 type:complete len:701 (-) Transcript_21392:22-2124(-)